MAFNISELDVLRKKLDRDRRELEERERALAKVEQMLREEMLNSSSSPAVPIVEPVQKSDSFTESVRIAVTSLGDREFTVHDVERYLQNMGLELPKSDPRSRIAMVLQMLRDKEAITRTHIGKGRDPHRYRVKQQHPTLKGGNP